MTAGYPTMSKQLLAVDIGAGSGRIIRGCFENNRLSLHEDARFSNRLLKDAEGYTCWDFERLAGIVAEYLKKTEEGDSIGFDSFSPDFGIFDGDGKLCRPMLSYHNFFQASFPEQILREYSADELHDMIGNPENPLATVSQMCHLQDRYEFASDRSCTLLPMADALAFSVCGERFTDITYSFDTGLNDLNGAWDERLTRFLKAGSDILPRVLPCGETVAYSQRSSGKRTAVVNTALHDTASAYHALRLLADGQLCMNAGTWFSIGVSARDPVLTAESKRLGIENIALPEGFVHGYTFPGAWFLQAFQKERAGLPFSEIATAVQKEQGEFIPADVSDISRYQGPDGLIETIRRDMWDAGIRQSGDFQVLRSLYEGLAEAAAQAVVWIETVSHKQFREIYMSGGVTQDAFLCRLIGEKTGKQIVTCMREASVAGNLLLQLQALRCTTGEDESRDILKNMKEQEKSNVTSEV